MNALEQAERLAEAIRREPYVLFKYDCISKSKELRRRGRALGIPVRVVVCLGLSPARWFGRWLTIPVIHAWGEVAGKRLETSRPLGAAGIWGIVPANIRPVIAIWT